MSFTLFSISIIAILAVAICRQVFKGYKRGLSFMLIDLAVIVFSALVGAAVSNRIASAFEPLIIELVNTNEFFLELQASMPNFSVIIGAVLLMIVSLLLYLPVFVILRALLSFVIWVLRKTLLKEKNAQGYTGENDELYERKIKKGGALVGILTGIALTVIMTMPLLATIGVAGDIVTVVENYSGEEGAPPELESFYSLKTYRDDAPSMVLRAVGADMLFKIVARAEVQGEITYLDKEVRALAGFDVQGLMSLFSDFGTESEGADVDELVGAMEDSLVIRLLAADVVSSASKAWMKGESYLGIDRPSFGDDNIVAPFMDKLFEVCSTTTARTVTGDISTLLTVCTMLSEVQGVLDSGSYTELITELSSDGVVGRIETELKANAHMAPLANVVHEMAMRTMVGELNSLDEGGSYNELLKKITDSLNSFDGPVSESVMISSLTSDVEKYLGEYADIYVPDGVADVFVETIVAELGDDRGDISVSQLEKLLASYLGSSSDGEE